MDPLSAIGLAASIVQFVDFATKLIHESRQIYASGNGTATGNADFELCALELESLCNRLNLEHAPSRSPDDAALYRLASRCKGISNDLSTLLRNLKPKDPKSKWDCFVTAVKTQLKKPDRDDLLARISECRAQLDIQLNRLSGLDNKTLHQQIVQALQSNEHGVQLLLNNLQSLRDNVTISSLSPYAETQLRRMMALPYDTQNAINTRRILNLLQFEDMQERFNRVDAVHESKFAWAVAEELTLDHTASSEVADLCEILPAVDDLSNTPDIEAKWGIIKSLSASFDSEHGCQNKFASWLLTGKGLFHIVGKPESGKSTLMKAICNNQPSKRLLETWAAGARLVFAKFFIWKEGTKKQKTIQGMCRAILYEILEQCPELTSAALPEAWKTMESSPWQVEVKAQLSFGDVQDALLRILKDRGVHSKYKFVIFLDGIDEYDEASFDYALILDLLSSWLDSGQTNVKICVSSRPVGILLSVFSADQRIWVDNHTSIDLRKLVYDRLQALCSPQGRDTLTKSPPLLAAKDQSRIAVAEHIISRADGNLRWASLAAETIARIIRTRSNQVPRSQMAQDMSEEDNEKASLLEKWSSHITFTATLEDEGIPAWPTTAGSWSNKPTFTTGTRSMECFKNAEFCDRTQHIHADLRKEQSQELEKYLRVLDKLEDDLFAVVDARAEGTCKWLSLRASYQSWRDNSSDASKVLWIRGMPASGKSTLAGYVVNELQSTDAHCSFFFFKYDNNSKSNLSACLRALAIQMARQDSGIRRKLLEMKEKVDLSGTLDNAAALWRKLFVDGIFQTTFERQYWVIDALDECEDSATVFSSMLGKFDVSVPLSILITSRETPSMQAGFASLRPGLVCEDKLSPVDTMCDIRLLVEAKIKTFVAIGEEFREALVDNLLANSKGSFLWVVLVLKELSNAHSEEEVNRVLEELPKGMESLYHRTLRLMSNLGRGKKLAKAILTWATCAVRPLTMEELDELLKIELKESFPKLEASMASLCGQLVVVDKYGNMQMIHETARGFLLQDSLQSEYAVDPLYAHTQLAKVCLEYLAGETMKIPRLNRRRMLNSAMRTRTAFTGYACFNFSYHLARADPRSSDVSALLDKFLTANVLSWIEFISSTSSLHPMIQTSKNLRTYLQACEPYRPPLETAEAWTTDLVRISTKFADALITSPAAIFSLIPPFCPTKSAIHSIAATGLGLSMVGMPMLDWDDRLWCIDFHAQTRSVCYGDKAFAVGLETGVVALYSALTGQEYKVFQHNEPVNYLTFVGDKGSVASCGTKTIKVWDVASVKPIHVFQVPQRCIKLEYDNDSLIAVCDKNYIASWDLRKNGLRHPDRPWHAGTEIQDAQLRRSPSAISISHGHRMLAAAYPDRPILLWDLEEDMCYGTCGRKLSNGKTKQHLVTALILNSNPDVPLLVASYLDGELGLFDPFKDICLKYFRANCPKLAASPDGRLLAGATGSGVVNVYEFETLELLYKINSSSLSIRQIAFSSDCITLVDIRGSQCNVWQPVLLHQDSVDGYKESSSLASCLDVVATETKSKITTMVLLNDEGWVLSGRNDGLVSLYDLQNGTLLKELYWHKSTVHILTWWSKTNTIMSVDTSNSITAWKISRLQNNGSLLGHRSFQCRLESGKSITQMLTGEAINKFILSTRGSDHLWSAEGHEEVSRAYADRPGIRKWLQHPQSSSHVLCIEASAARILTWSDMSEVSCISFSTGNIDLQLKSTLFCSMDSKESILIELCELDGGCNTRDVRLLDADSLSIAETTQATNGLLTSLAEKRETKLLGKGDSPICRAAGRVRAAELMRISDRISHILGFSDAGTLVFLDKHSWVCSIAREQSCREDVLYLRHFFVPYDWFAWTNDIICAVSKRNVLLARNDRIGIVKNGLEFSEAVTLLEQKDSSPAVAEGSM